ncbi:MAG: adenylate/guanylate cyclase domain-containing protein [bacterium]
MSTKVFEWLEGLGLTQYAAAFEENDIGWELLVDIDQETLKDIGIRSAGHRLKILKAAGNLNSEQAIDASTASRTIPPKSTTNPETADEISGWSRTPGERKPVTMLFADIVGSTSHTEQLDAEDAHDLLYRATQGMCQAVEDNKGTVCRFMGDGIMAMFGAPVASERHALEACHAALSMQSRINGYATEPGLNDDTRIQIRVGLHSGEVVVLEVGDDPNKPEYDASGPTVPLAARMEQSADAGTILITEATRVLAGNLIDTIEQPAVTVKGISEPISVHHLNNVRSAVELPENTVRYPMVGRKSELAQFRGLLEECLDSGNGQTVLVRGEAGIGKTRLVEEIANLAKEDGFNLHKALVLDFGAGKGQGAVPALTRSLLGISPGSGKNERAAALTKALNEGFASSEQCVYLNDLLDLTQPIELRILYDAMDAESRSVGKCLALADLLTKLSTKERLLLVVEDLHWADEITMEYLAGLTAAVAGCSALMVMTSRAEGDPVDKTWRARAGGCPIVTWDLGPLRTEESERLVSGFIDASNDLARRCIERAAGNPLFLEQLLLGVKENTSGIIPDSIKSLVLARMDQLPGEDKQALRAAAVLGQRFDPDSLRYLVDQPAYETKVLVEHNLMRPEGSLYLFAHALIQEGAYASLIKRDRLELHGRAAEWFATRDAVLHAEHLDRAEDASAAEAYLNAARDQSASYRHKRALQLVARGLEIASDKIQFDLSCLQGELLILSGSTQESIEAYQKAHQISDDDIEACKALIGVAEGLGISGEYQEQIEVLRNAEIHAKRHELTLELARIYRMWAGLYFFRGEIEACLETSLESLKYAREAGSPEDESRALSALGDAEYNRGRFLSAYNYFDQCLDLASKHGFGRVIAVNLSMRAVTSQWLNDVESCAADSRAGLELAKKTHELWAELITMTVGARLWAELGDPVEGKEWIAKGIDISRHIRSNLMEGMILYVAARIAMLEGDHIAAYRLSKDTMSILSKTESGMTFHGAGVLGLIASTTENDQERREALAEAESMLSEGSVGHNYLDFYEDAMETGLRIAEWDEVDRYAQALEDYTRPEPLPRCDFFIARGRALAAHGRGNRDRATMAELQHLHDEAETIGLKFLLPALEIALASG